MSGACALLADQVSRILRRDGKQLGVELTRCLRGGAVYGGSLVIGR